MRASGKHVDRYYDAFSPQSRSVTSQKLDGDMPAGSKSPQDTPSVRSWGYARRVKTWIAEPAPGPPCRPCLVPRFWDRGGGRPGGGHRRYAPVPEWAERWTGPPRLLTVNRTVGTKGGVVPFLLEQSCGPLSQVSSTPSSAVFSCIAHLYRDKHTGIELRTVGLGSRDAHDRPPTAPFQPSTQ